MPYFTMLVLAEDEQELEEKMLPYTTTWENFDVMSEEIKNKYFEFEDRSKGHMDNYKREVLFYNIEGELYFYFEAEKMYNLKVLKKLITDEFEKFPEDTYEKVTITLEKYYGSYEKFLREYYGFEDWKTGDEEGVWVNKNGKCKSWSIGGKYSGLIFLKEKFKDIPSAKRKPYGMFDSEYHPFSADSALVKDIDFKKMLDEISIIPENINYQTYKEIYTKYVLGHIDKETFNAILFNRLGFLSKEKEHDLQNMPQKHYLDKYASNRALTYGFIDKQGEWNAIDIHGYLDKNESYNPEYDKKFWDFIESLKENDRLYLIECYI